MMNLNFQLFIFLMSAAAITETVVGTPAYIIAATATDTLKLPERTSRYNRGGTNSPFAGRHRDKEGKIRRFELTGGTALLYHGGGELIGTVTKPLMLNKGAVTKMTVNGEEGTFLWAWKTNAGLSGWVNRLALVDAPDTEAELRTSAELNPAPPKESKNTLKIDARTGTLNLRGLSHTNSQGVLPAAGNKGEHYAGRNPGPLDYVYLLFAVPNVQKGGTAKNSMPDGSLFVPALDESGKMIMEVMTMYRDADLSKPVKVTFLYGRPINSKMYGWVARANVGEL